MKDYGMTKVDVDDTDLIRPNADVPVPQNVFDMDIQQRNARNHRREIEASLDEVKSLIHDPETARSMTYRLERWDSKTKKMKIITGPSIRCAELIAYAWGNLKWGSRVVEVTATRVIAEGMCIDLERNLAVAVQASRNIVGKNGVRYSEDLIQLQEGVAKSIAMRNAMLAVVPGVFQKRILDHADRIVQSGGSVDVSKRWEAAVRWGQSEGLDEAELLRFVGVPSATEIRPSDIDRLIGAANAIREGESTVDDIFRRPYDQAKVDDADDISKPEPPSRPQPQQTDPEPKRKRGRPRRDAEPPKAVEPETESDDTDETDEEDPETDSSEPQRESLTLVNRNDLDKAKEALQKHTGQIFVSVWEVLQRANLHEDPRAIMALTRAPRPIIQASFGEPDVVEAIKFLIQTGMAT